MSVLQEKWPVSVPGRVNLIGEHTDYTGGLVLPMAIGFETSAEVHPATEGYIVRSAKFDSEVLLSNESLKPRGDWSDYPVGVLWALREANIEVPLFRLTIEGNIPLGAGLSSSASIEVATALALLHLSGRHLSGEQIAVLCQRAENDFVGSVCGIMDQFVVTMAKAGHALLLDTRSLTYEHLPLPSSAKVVVCNSMVKHSVATGEYGDRRAEVEAGQAAIGRSLRDVTPEQLEVLRPKMSATSYRRCKHIVTENRRVIAAKDALQRSDLELFGKLMNEAHTSFRDDFEASCAEVDMLVNMAKNIPGCYGARITGGGFGGCTVNLVEASLAESFKEALVQQYETATGVHADCFITQAEAGAMSRLAEPWT